MSKPSTGKLRGTRVLLGQAASSARSLEELFRRSLHLAGL